MNRYLDPYFVSGPNHDDDLLSSEYEVEERETLAAQADEAMKEFPEHLESMYAYFNATNGQSEDAGSQSMDTQSSNGLQQGRQCDDARKNHPCYDK